MVSNFPVFCKDDLKNHEKINNAFSHHGGFFVADIFDENTLATIRKVYEKNIKNWSSWKKEYVKETTVSIISVQKHKKWKNPIGRKSTPVETFKNAIDGILEPIINDWSKNITGCDILSEDMFSSDTQLLRGPSTENQPVHFDSFFPMLCFIGYLSNCAPTRIVNYEHYNITFELVRNLLNEKFNLDWCAHEEFPPDFNVSFLDKLFPLVGSCLRQDPEIQEVCKKTVKRGTGLFFDSRLLHGGVAHDDERLLIFRNWVSKKNLSPPSCRFHTSQSQ